MYSNEKEEVHRIIAPTGEAIKDGTQEGLHMREDSGDDILLTREGMMTKRMKHRGYCLIERASLTITLELTRIERKSLVAAAFSFEGETLSVNKKLKKQKRKVFVIKG